VIQPVTSSSGLNANRRNIVGDSAVLSFLVPRTRSAVTLVVVALVIPNAIPQSALKTLQPTSECIKQFCGRFFLDKPIVALHIRCPVAIHACGRLNKRVFNGIVFPLVVILDPVINGTLGVAFWRFNKHSDHVYCHCCLFIGMIYSDTVSVTTTVDYYSHLIFESLTNHCLTL
jgi:hypothetical protein